MDQEETHKTVKEIRDLAIIKVKEDVEDNKLILFLNITLIIANPAFILILLKIM